MQLNIIVTLLISHFIGDFVFQSRKMAENKSKSLPYLLLHIFVIIMSLNLPAMIFKIAWFVPIVYGLLHGMQDLFLWKFYKYLYSKLDRKVNYYEDYWFYFTIGLDQLIHLIVLFLIFH